MDLLGADTHPFVKTYLRYVENTETPKVMHIWSALSGISACMGRRCWLPFATGDIYPNMFVILTGPPAVRKSTAFRTMSKLLRQYTGVRFAPDDTGGQRQGLIAAMSGASEKGTNDEDEEIIKRISKGGGNTLGKDSAVTLADLQADLDALGAVHLDTRDPCTLFVAASELNSFLGEGNTSLLTFLGKMYDGEPYEYVLKNTSHTLTDALLGLIGATTPSQIALALPAEAVGQGFTSRAVFVYADTKSMRKIARPSMDETVKDELGNVYAKVFNEFSGAFTEASPREMDAIYERGIVVKDPRFVYYADRRHSHFQKLCMALAASRGEQTIRSIDIQFADQLLLYTEERMPDALGEYGMNKLGAAKQRMLEMLSHSTDPIPVTMLYGMLSRDMSQLEYKNTLNELHNAGKITLTVLPVLGQCVIAVDDTAAKRAKREISQIENLMARKG